MKSAKLYQQLEKDFITPKLSDDWARHMDFSADFFSGNFKKRSMGLVCDFAIEITKVYTAVFPSKKIMQKILDDRAQDTMLFVHHPAIWDIRKAPEIFQPMDRKLLQKFKDHRISIYNLHTPLDNFGEYSTSVALAKALDIKPKKSFAPYFGALAGVFGKTTSATIQNLKKTFQEAVGHEVSLYNYGDDKIKNETVAVVAGGGNDIEILEEISKAGINTLATGVTLKNDHSEKAHEFAEKHKINILGGTHYSTEKFACISMVDYFEKLGLLAEFIEDEPMMEDL
ncbi:MAG: Nif3-like dinuclear metal center hexameric protein [Candidatus Moranbacteria bacterium]|nr:Nif3-like dinuclear metal center hexameric protein [Candidatus Moranbacteria bacterium]